MILWVPGLFFGIAFVFSMLGMGGGQLYVPLLYWAGLDLKAAAIPLGLLLNVLTTVSAAWVYARKGLVDWKVALPFGIAMVVLPPVGVLVNAHLPPRPILLIFALFTAAAALLMLSGWQPRQRLEQARAHALLGVGGGGVLGFFTGLIGRGGGSFVVPLLYLAGLEPRRAAATSAVVVTLSGISGVLAHLKVTARPQWPLWLATIAAVLLGSQLGARVMVTRLDSRRIKLLFGWLLLGVAFLIVVKDVL